MFLIKTLVLWPKWHIFQMLFSTAANTFSANFGLKTYNSQWLSKERGKQFEQDTQNQFSTTSETNEHVVPEYQQPFSSLCLCLHYTSLSWSSSSSSADRQCVQWLTDAGQQWLSACALVLRNRIAKAIDANH